MREDKAELRARVFLLEKERASLELRLNSQDGHQAAQMATIEHLQSQLLEAQQKVLIYFFNWTNRLICFLFCAFSQLRSD